MLLHTSAAFLLPFSIPGIHIFFQKIPNRMWLTVRGATKGQTASICSLSIYISIVWTATPSVVALEWTWLTWLPMRFLGPYHWSLSSCSTISINEGSSATWDWPTLSLPAYWEDQQVCLVMEPSFLTGCEATQQHKLWNIYPMNIQILTEYGSSIVQSSIG